MKKLLFALSILIGCSFPIMAQNLELGNSFILPASPAQDQVVLENASIVNLTQDGNTFKIIPIKLGKTFVYIWNKQNQMTCLPIQVVSKGYNEQLTLQEKLAKKINGNQENLKIKISSVIGSTQSKVNGTTYNSEWGVWQLGGSGQSSFGKYSSLLQLEKRDTLSQIVLGYVQLENEAFSLSVGDSWMNISPLLGTYLPYQGAQLTNIRLDKNLKMNILAGATNKYFWGQDIWQQSANKKLFGGINIRKDDSKLNLFLNLFWVQNSYNKVRGTSYGLGSIGGGYNLNPLMLNFEGAVQSTGKKAIQANATYANKGLSYTLEGKTIDQGFEGLSDYSTNDIQGIYNTLGYTLTDYLKINGKFNAYMRPSFASSMVYEKAVGFQYNQAAYLPKVDVNYWELDRRNLDLGGIHHGFSVYAAQNLYFIPSILYVNYRPFSFDSTLSPSLNVETTVLTAGLNNNLFNLANFVLEATQENPKNIGDSQPAKTYSAQLYSNQLTLLDFKTIALNTDFSVKYEKHFTNNTNDYNGTYANITLKVKQEWVDDLYFNYLKQYKNTNEDSGWKVGIQTTVDTGLKLIGTPTYRVRGVVFEDLNKNGKRDQNESTVAGFKITNADNNTTTKADGYYELPIGYNPYLNISTSKYPYYQLYLNNPYRLPANNKEDVLLDIPVTFLRKVTMVAYFDANQNGIYDEGYDQLLPNAKFILINKDTNTNTAIVSATGKEVLDLTPQEAVNGAISIDLTSIAPELIPANSQNLTQSIPLDQDGVIAFPFNIK